MSRALPSMLDAERTVDPAGYALGGRAPRMALKPGSGDEVALALEAATRDHAAVIAWGAGTRIARDRAPERYDIALDLSGLDRILEYNPEDFTLTAECGATLATLRRTLAARGQELPIESPQATRATLGGTLAANASGPRRLRFGAPRDRILGARIALSDGTRIKSGGKVVKNVAGYALHRLLCGARGRWGLFLEASIKLAPGAESCVALLYSIDAGEIADAERWRFLPRLEPAFFTVLGAQAAQELPLQAGLMPPFAMVIGLEDDAAWVAEQERMIAERLGPPIARLEGEAQSALVQKLTDAELHLSPRVSFTSAHNNPSILAPLISTEGAGQLVHHVLAGRLHWYSRATGTVPAEGSALFAAFGFTVIESVGVRYEPGAPAEGAILALRARIGEALDPLGTLQVPGD
jgi:FAD/FMN-containing dehydrogenase